MLALHYPHMSRLLVNITQGPGPTTQLNIYLSIQCLIVWKGNKVMIASSEYPVQGFFNDQPSPKHNTYSSLTQTPCWNKPRTGQDPCAVAMFRWAHKCVKDTSLRATLRELVSWQAPFARDGSFLNSWPSSPHTGPVLFSAQEACILSPSVIRFRTASTSYRNYRSLRGPPLSVNCSAALNGPDIGHGPPLPRWTVQKASQLSFDSKRLGCIFELYQTESQITQLVIRAYAIIACVGLLSKRSIRSTEFISVNVPSL